MELIRFKVILNGSGEFKDGIATNLSTQFKGGKGISPEGHNCVSVLCHDGDEYWIKTNMRGDLCACCLNCVTKQFMATILDFARNGWIEILPAKEES